MDIGNSVKLVNRPPEPATVGVLIWKTKGGYWHVAWDDGHESCVREDKLLRWPKLGDERYKE